MGNRTSRPDRVVHPEEDAPSSDSEVRARRRLSTEAGSIPTPRDAGGIRASRGHRNMANNAGTRLHVLPTGEYMLEDEKAGCKQLSDSVVNWFTKRNRDTLQVCLAFVPWIVQQAYFDGGLDQEKIVVHRGSGALVFADTSGFTALTERLARRSNGAELLSDCLIAFFTPLINLINAYRGDVIKFSGDALTIYFPAVDDEAQGRPRHSKMRLPPHGSFGLPDLGPMATAVLRASACCIEIQKRLHMFNTNIDGVQLCLHIGIGCGQVTILHVGGVIPPETHVPRSEYLVAGPPLQQVSIAEPLAQNGEICLSPEAWDHVSNCVIEDTSRKLDVLGFRLLLRLDERQYTFPTIKFSAMENDRRHEKQFRLSELDVIRRYIPSPVFKQIQGGTLTYVNEMRQISTIFISGSGVDASTDKGACVAQELMASVQKVCYRNEGTLNKFVIDDKGMLLLLVFGLPPLVHTDDPTRAVLTCLETAQVFERLRLDGRFGVTTGRAYCGVCGSASRMEYTVLGDPVNLSARLMGNAPQDGILIDDATKQLLSRELYCVALPPIKVKGKEQPIAIFHPFKQPEPNQMGLSVDGQIIFPWYHRPLSMSQQLAETEEQSRDKSRVNVDQLFDLPNWEGVVNVQRLLGSPPDGSLNGTMSDTPVIDARTWRLPPGSPFANGGVLFLEGPTGTGKIEFAEYVASHAKEHLGMLPVVGSMGTRLSDLERLGVELLRSTLSVFRYLASSSNIEFPADDFQAAEHLLPNQYMIHMPVVQQAFQGRLNEEDSERALFTLVEVVVSLLDILRQQTSIFVIMLLEQGTSIFPKTLERFNCFWNVVSTLAAVATPAIGGNKKPIVLVVLSKEADRNSPAVMAAIDRGHFVQLPNLSTDVCLEYAAVYLQVPRHAVPQPLLEFVSRVSLGNPLYVRETIDQLVKNDHIRVWRDQQGQLKNLDCEDDLEDINIASWAQTAMVGTTACLLESLDPLESAVLKMSTVFQGSFTLPDLASSSCSRWAGATHFDYLRLFRAVQELVDRRIIQAVQTGSGQPCTAQLQAYEMRNMLIRKVGGAMVLEAQKKRVKRQALIDRALLRDLPARMEQLRVRRLEPHIPWYYESVLAKASY
mmetsp:Transcript_103034/g.204506  ORF Transcript_103034/g.204506 Transcript_103034/m.204506 type:complete len:1108 (-) Transcript_103034:330-3653(-)